MLGEAGIEARVTNGRSYRGAIRGNFSYRDQGGGGPRPAVWVVRSDQQPAARRLLREAGLLQSPSRADSFLAVAAPSAGGTPGAPAARGGSRFRYGLLLAVAVIAALALLSWRAGDDAGSDSSAAPATVPDPAPAVVPIDAVPDITSLPDEAFRVPTPPALAATLLRNALEAAGGTRGCLGIDGADPDAALLAELAGTGLDVVAASACDGDRLPVLVSAYTTDGSGSGTVEVVAGTGEPRTVDVRREGRDWRVAE